MTTKTGPRSGRSPSTPWTTCMAASGDGSGRGGRDEDLVRGEPTGSGRGDRHERAVRISEPIVVGRAGEPARRPDELALGHGRELVGGQGHDREGVETCVEREKERKQPRRALCR